MEFRGYLLRYLCMVAVAAGMAPAVLRAEFPPAPSSAGEYVVLTSGQRMRADYHNVSGNSVRLFQAGGYVDLPLSLIRAYEPIQRTPQPTPAEPVPPASLVNSEVTSVDSSDLEPVQPRFSTSDPRQMVREAAAQAGLPPEFVESVAQVESAFRPDAISPKGAVGVMQLMPATAAKLGADPHDLEQNITAGTQLLRQLLLRYDGDVAKALAAYNAGEGAVDRYDGIPPYRETQFYVNKVIGAYLKAGGE